MKKTFLFFLLGVLWAKAQVITDYPANQIPYQGGYEAYYKDFRDIIVQKNLKPCTDQDEFYQFSLLINTDATINFVKDLNKDYLDANKCAADLAREVAKHQTKWNPAIINGVKQPAVAHFSIYPALLFEEGRTDYTPEVIRPVYNNSGPQHMQHFSKQLKANFDLRRFSWNDRFTVEADFIITKEGKLEDIVLTKKTDLVEFDRMIYYAFKGMRKKWNPATVNGKPVDYRYKYQLTAVTDPDTEY